jgi:S1-C subfamily serine protease
VGLHAVERVNGSATVIVALHKVSSVPAGLQQTMDLYLGSGVLVSKNGKVITSAHLVNTADQIKRLRKEQKWLSSQRLKQKIWSSVTRIFWKLAV